LVRVDFDGGGAGDDEDCPILFACAFGE